MKRGLLTGLLLACTLSAIAAPIGFDFWNHLDSNDGLSQNEVHCILQDHRGLMWFGTQDGLNCYDGHRMEVYHQIPFDSTSLSDDFITTIYQDSQQRLWVGTVNGLNCYQFGSAIFRRIEQITNVVTALKEDKNRVLWVNTATGWWTLKPNETTWRPSKSGLNDDKKQFSNELMPLLPPQTTISALLTDHLGIIWVGTQGKGIFRFRLDGQKHKYVLLDALEEDFSGKNGLKSSHITCIYEGNEPNEDVVWIGTREAGVQLYSRSKNNFKHWERLFVKESASDKTFFGLGTDRKGFFWAGTYAHLYRIHRQTHAIRAYSVAPSTVIETTLEDNNGKFWVGGNTGLYHYDHTKERFLRYPLPLRNGRMPWVFKVYEDDKKDLWVGTRGYLANITPNGKTQIWRELTTVKNTKIKIQNVGTLQRDTQGALWIGMREGLVYWPANSKEAQLFNNHPKDNKSLISNTVLDIHIDPQQRVWICTTKGLSQVKSTKGKIEFEHFTEKEGLPNSFIYGALSDDEGHIWLTTNGGLVCFNPEKRTFRTYNAQDGLGGMEFNSGGLHRSQDGELFLGGNGMLLSLQPNQLAINQHLPKIVLTSFKKFEKPVLNIDSLLDSNQPIVLNYDENFFSFEWAGLDFTNASRNQFAYRLEGFDKTWVYIGTRHFVDFTNLNPGYYTLWVKAANNEGIWNEKEMLHISLIIRPPFWQTWWFYGVAALLIALFVKLLYEYRIHHLLALERAKLEENERVRKLAAQDLHDEFGNTLTRISLLTELVKNRMNGQATTEIGDLLTKISDNANRMYHGTKDFIWAINPEHDSLYEIAVRLKDFGDDVFDKTGIEFSVEGLTNDLHALTLLTGESRHLVLLFKEAMSNTLKHAKATQATLSFSLQTAHLQIQWQDNGKGFDILQNKYGNGLVNIQTRAEKIGGEITFQNHGGTAMSVVFTKIFPSSPTPRSFIY